ncbi:2-dehydro-3-deoxygalactonokinase [Sulfitobacter undariae]|uniref:2-dehydro-3-deoxygalactonokinase n=1 Tax=Sulfitobacter undariae TaxID=1563671 RepID=A0A7W6H0X6_9RHOB|nr:2-dehydro-3-deoxygalactonokinase [Sulfitobacter undariae]MBB3995386.1 2-dehydro-3-deoxygalactonokinase [Sulfitobacter undariae]
MNDDRWAAAVLIGKTLHLRVHNAGAVTDMSETLTTASYTGSLLQMLAPFLEENSVLPILFAGPSALNLVNVPAVPPSSFVPLQEIDPRVAVMCLDGMAQTQPADVMDGQVAQILGFLAANPEWDGVLCLAGARSNWVHISAGEVVSFQTFMTGEVIEMLAADSALSRALEGTGWDDAAFEVALSDAMSRPERAVAALFSLHAEERLVGHNPAKARARLSGMWIGMEMAAARPYWLGQNVAIIGEAAVAEQYQAALRTQGVIAPCCDAVDMAFRGVAHAYAGQKD